MKILQKISYAMWAVPFLFFMVGYAGAYFYMQKKSVEVPSIMGLTVQEAVGVLARHNMAMRLRAEKEDEQFPEGTILQQVPAAYQRVRPQQSIFVTIAKAPQKILAPDFFHKDSSTIERNAAHLKIATKQIQLKSRYPKNLCFAQSVTPGQPLERLKMIAYISAGDDELVIMPNVVGLPLDQAQDFFKRSGVQVQVVGLDGPRLPTDRVTIVEQNPMVGTIIDLAKFKHVHLQVGLQ
ncbi:PASTA domain-containing protein [bacterium]|nr:MAG: PASTA domain-containing protein [bacterium]